MGRPRTPTNVLQLRGAFAKNPQRKRPDEPKPEKDVGNPPACFDEDHRAIWREIKKNSAAGVLTISDRIALEVLCCLVRQFRSDPVAFSGAKLARMESLFGKFGFTPADRSKVSVKAKKPANAFSDF